MFVSAIHVSPTHSHNLAKSKFTESPDSLLNPQEMSAGTLAPRELVSSFWRAGVPPFGLLNFFDFFSSPPADVQPAGLDSARNDHHNSIRY